MSKYKWMIVNEELKPFPENGKVNLNEYGLPVFVDDYGNGAVHWSLIEDKSEWCKRERIDKVLNAVEHLVHLAKNEKDYAEYAKEYLDIIEAEPERKSFDKFMLEDLYLMRGRIKRMIDRLES